MRRRFFSSNSKVEFNDNYLTIVALEDELTASLSTNNCEYCIDGDGDWITLTAGTTTQSINAGQTLSFRGELTPSSSSGIGTFTISKKCNLEGNCMSMLFGDNAADNFSLEGKAYAFYRLFGECSNIVNVSSNFLPATTLANNCYNSMFMGCTTLIVAPELPATTLAYRCYFNMFRNCTSLTTAPELPATTLADNCYIQMFQDCTSLTTAPEILPATTLADSCYGNMFRNCPSLITAPELPATTLTNKCYLGMFKDCTSLTTSPELPATTLANECYHSMFYGCTSLTTAPELPATTLAYRCYYFMFYNCTSLTSAPQLPATIMKGYCYYAMFYCCTSLINTPELPAVEAWSTSEFHDWAYMFEDCTSLTKAPVLKTKILGDRCYRGMFAGCTKLTHIEMHATDISASDCLTLFLENASPTGTIYIPKGVTLPIATSSNDYNGIPSGWTVVDLITFTIESVEYQAVEGMTWEEWVESDYNTEGFTPRGSKVFCGGESFVSLDTTKNFVSLDDAIISNYTYFIVSSGK